LFHRPAAVAAVIASLILTAVFPQDLATQQPVAPSVSDLAAITERGRALHEYDLATWHATDAVQMANPKTAQGQHYLASKQNGKWTVVFGALNSQKTRFLIHYEAVEAVKPGQFAIQHLEPAREETGFFLFAARALELALADFGPQSRSYNVAVIPAPSSDSGAWPGLFVYLYPGQTRAGIYPLGGDARYVVSADGTVIVAKRQLHKSVIENRPPKGKKVAAGFHTHVLSELPEDSDVLHVLQQDPPVPEFVSTDHFLYEITADGSIQIKKSRKN
jgi:hypothetical protein